MSHDDPFSFVDGAIDTTTDIVSTPFNWVGDFVEGTAETAGNSVGSFTGGLFGGMFGGLGNWIFQLAALGVVALVALKVVA